MLGGNEINLQKKKEKILSKCDNRYKQISRH